MASAILKAAPHVRAPGLEPRAAARAGRAVLSGAAAAGAGARRRPRGAGAIDGGAPVRRPGAAAQAGLRPQRARSAGGGRAGGAAGRHPARARARRRARPLALRRRHQRPPRRTATSCSPAARGCCRNASRPCAPSSTGRTSCSTPEEQVAARPARRVRRAASTSPRPRRSAAPSRWPRGRARPARLAGREVAGDARGARRGRALPHARDDPRLRPTRSWRSAATTRPRPRCATASTTSRMAKAARNGLRGPQQADWLWRVEVELDNIRSAIALSLAGGVDPFIAVKFAVAMQGFWILRGYSTEGRKLLQAALALPAIQASPIAQAFALYVGASLAESQSDHAEARKMLETCLELRRELDSEVDIAATLSTLSLTRLQARRRRRGRRRARARRCRSSAASATGSARRSACSISARSHLHQGDDATARVAARAVPGDRPRDPAPGDRGRMRAGARRGGAGDGRPGPGLPALQALADGLSRGRRQARRGERAALAGAGRPAGGRCGVGAAAPGRGLARLPGLRDARGAARLPRGPCRARPGRRPAGGGRRRAGRGGAVTPAARPDAIAARPSAGVRR